MSTPTLQPVRRWPGWRFFRNAARVGLVGAVQYALRGVAEEAGAAARGVVIGMVQHDLVHVDVAVVGGQFLGVQIRHRDLRHEGEDCDTRRLERRPGGRRQMDAVRHDRQYVTDVEFEREQIALPADHLQRVVLVEDRAVAALMAQPHLVFRLSGPAVIAPAVINHIGHFEHGRVDRRVAADILVLGHTDRPRRLDDQQHMVAVVGHLAEIRALRQMDVVAGLVLDRAELGGEGAAAAMHEIEEVADHVAIAVRHRLPPPADRDRDIIVRQQHLPVAARVIGVGRDHIGAVDRARPVVALDPHDLVRPLGAIEHRHRALEAVPREMLLAQLAEPDPRLPHETAAGEMDP